MRKKNMIKIPIILLLSLLVTLSTLSLSYAEKPTITTGTQVSQGLQGPAGYSTLEDYPVGTKFTVYPKAPFDFIDRQHWNGTGDFNVHICSFRAELTKKNSFSEFSKDPSLGDNGYYTYTFHPYESTITVCAHVDPKYAGKRNIIIWYYTSLKDGPESMSSDVTINPDGDFSMVQKKYWTVPVTIWFSGMAINTIS